MSAMLQRNEMKQVDLAEIRRMALEAKYGLWAAARQNGRDVKLYLHWTAGRYGQFWDDYHIQIDGDGAVYAPGGVDFTTVLPATYRRNSGSIAIALLAGVGATASGLGENPPTQEQIESMARVIAALAGMLDLTIDLERVMTHGEAADNEDGLDPGYEANGCPQGMYGPKHSVERWDLEYLGTAESPAYNPWATDGGAGAALANKVVHSVLNSSKGEMPNIKYDNKEGVVK